MESHLQKQNKMALPNSDSTIQSMGKDGTGRELGDVQGTDVPGPCLLLSLSFRYSGGTRNKVHDHHRIRPKLWECIYIVNSQFRVKDHQTHPYCKRPTHIKQIKTRSRCQEYKTYVKAGLYITATKCKMSATPFLSGCINIHPPVPQMQIRNSQKTRFYSLHA